MSEKIVQLNEEVNQGADQRIGAQGMCQAFIDKVSFDERRVFKIQLSGLCLVYVYSKAHRLTAALA